MSDGTRFASSSRLWPQCTNGCKVAWGNAAGVAWLWGDSEVAEVGHTFRGILFVTVTTGSDFVTATIAVKAHTPNQAPADLIVKEHRSCVFLQIRNEMIAEETVRNSSIGRRD